MTTFKFCNDILRIIASYLMFDEKVVFGKLCGMIFLRFYDFNNNPEFKMCDDISCIFAMSENYYNDIKYSYMCFSNAIIENYIKTEIKNENSDHENTKDHVHDQDGSNDQDEDDNSNYTENEESEYDSDDDFDHDLDIFPYYGVSRDIHKYQHKDDYWRNRDEYYNHFDNRYSGGYNFDEIFNNSIFFVHIKKMIEYIENNEIKIKYNKEINHDAVEGHIYLTKINSLINLDALESQLPIDLISDNVCDYYANALLYSDMNDFCRRCANFGHSGEENECIFYNKEYADKKIQKKLKREQEEKQKEEDRREKTIQQNLKRQQEEKQKKNAKEKKQLANEEHEKTWKLISCVRCKKNQRKQSCPENACVSCCSSKHQDHTHTTIGKKSNRSFINKIVIF